MPQKKAGPGGRPLRSFFLRKKLRRKQLALPALGQQAERLPVVDAGARCGNGAAVSSGGVALVLVPAVVGKKLVQLQHVSVAGGLGEYGSSCDGGIFAVAFDDAVMGQGGVRTEAIAIDEEQLGAWRELVDGAVHSQKGGLQDVDAVDFGRIYLRDSPADSVGFYELASCKSLLLSELFGIIEQGYVQVFGPDDSGSKDRAGEAASAGFVAAGLLPVGVKKVEKRFLHKVRMRVAANFLSKIHVCLWILAQSLKRNEQAAVARTGCFDRNLSCFRRKRMLIGREMQ